MDNVDPSNCVDVLKKANFSRVSSEEKLEIIRKFLNNPNFDEVDLYYLGLLDEESSEEEKIPETELTKQPSKSRRNLDNEIDLNNNPPSSSVKKIPNGKISKKREKKKKKKKAVVVFYDHSAPEAEAAEALLSLNHHPLPLDELPKKKKKKLKIIMSGKPIDCHCPVDNISGGPKKRPRTTTTDDQEEEEEDRCGRAKKRTLMMAPEVPPNLKKRIEKLGGSEVMLVIEKQLCQSDIITGNGRFSLPNKKTNPQFLTPEEREFLSRKTTTGSSPTLPQIEAQLIQPSGEELTINLREWHMKQPLYNLVTSWNDVVSTNSLHVGMTVQLWSFRVDSRLRLALVEAGKDIQ